ncbi:MAG: transposase [uncultured bacterium]|nr:MAG: transposase [uncultured bacterium]
MSLPRTKSKDLDPEILQRIHELSQEGLGSRKIALRLGLSRKVVRQILEQPKKKSQSLNKLDPFHVQIEQKVKVGLTATRILREIQALGYQGGRTILAQEVSRLRTQFAPKSRRPVKRRFETPPGKELQADWSPGRVFIAGRMTKINVLGMILASSRKLFYAIFRDERQSRLLEGLAQGFEYFEGSALRCVFDNMTSVVLGRTGADRKPIWHHRFLDFSKHYGFEPFLCGVADPDRKGKKEKSFRLVFDDFIKGSTFESWDDMSARLRIWLDHTPGVGNQRVHGTTGLVPNEAFLAEKKLLIALPSQRFPCFEEVIRAVDADSTISVQGIRYTVPAILAHRQVPVYLHANHFEVFDTKGQLHLSRRYVDPATHPGKLVIDPMHYAGLKKRPTEGQPRLDQAFVQRFPELSSLIDGLKEKMKGIAGIHLGLLLRLAESYGSDIFLAAARKAQEYRRFSAYAVKRILEREYPEPPENLTAPCNGLGAIILGEVEEADLDEFAHLDRRPATTMEEPHDKE